jgi:hypothetical protein
LATHQIGAIQKSTVVNTAAERPHPGRSGDLPSQTATGMTHTIWCVQVTGEISRPVAEHSAAPKKADQCLCTYDASSTPSTPKTPATVHSNAEETAPWLNRASAPRKL